jgi:hypothetical protein
MGGWVDGWTDGDRMDRLIFDHKYIGLIDKRPASITQMLILQTDRLVTETVII